MYLILKIECGTCGLQVPSVNYFCSCANIDASDLRVSNSETVLWEITSQLC